MVKVGLDLLVSDYIYQAKWSEEIKQLSKLIKQKIILCKSEIDKCWGVNCPDWIGCQYQVHESDSAIKPYHDCAKNKKIVTLRKSFNFKP